MDKTWWEGEATKSLLTYKQGIWARFVLRKCVGLAGGQYRDTGWKECSAVCEGALRCRCVKKGNAVQMCEEALYKQSSARRCFQYMRTRQSSWHDAQKDTSTASQNNVNTN
eukprot:1157408-Pelagomonas_calceolata.AAC.2